MLTQTRAEPAPKTIAAARRLSVRRRVLWTLGNLLMVAGLYLLAYVGGLYAEIEFQRLAARGDNDIMVPRTTISINERPQMASPLPARELAAAAPFSAPVLNNGQISSALPSAAEAAHVSRVERLVIPSIKLDAKVIEVGWSEQVVDGQRVAVWDVAEYAVGQHRGSANPGEGGNVVMAGHVGGFGQVFRDLYYVRPGEQITLYSGGQQFLYVIQERLVLDEEGAPPEQRAANAQLIAPTDYEVVTLVTCWPGSGPDKFKQRVVVRAVPFDAPADSAEIAQQTVR